MNNFIYKFIVVALFLIPVFHYGQVGTGINTGSPKQLFHLDGKKDNATTGEISTVQQRNDVVISSEGRLGIGVNTPSSSLQVNGNYTGKIVEMNEDGVVEENVQYVILKGTLTSVKLPDATTISEGRIYYIRNTLNRDVTISGFSSTQKIIVDSSIIPIESFTLQKGALVEIVRGFEEEVNGGTWYSFYSDMESIENKPVVYLGGAVYVNFNSTTGGNLINSRLIRSTPGASYRIATLTMSSAKGGLRSLKGNGYKISNPSAGIFDIEFDQPFTEIYGVSTNIVDAYGLGTGNLDQGAVPNPNQAGRPLNTKDNSQVAYVSNTIIRIRTGDSFGNPSNRSFTFLVTGK